MIAWMLYGVGVTLVIAASARAAEWIAKLARFRVRWIWAGALALTVFLSASAAIRGHDGGRSAAGSLTFGGERPGDGAAAGRWTRMLAAGVEQLGGSLDAPLRTAVAFVRQGVSPATERYVAAIASMMSATLMLILLGVEHRFQLARRRWPRTTVQGVDVRVAPRIGPVVIGIVRPEIIVPRWLLDRHADEQRLVVTHESEHVRARDSLLLGLAWIAVVIAPWNPLLWYMASRLRLAVELDCDARVLRRGAAPQPYGLLLIDVAQHAVALRWSALALADDSSHLHQRILAMKPRRFRFARLRSGLAIVFASAGVLVACQATLPVVDDHGSSAAASTTAKPNKGPFTGLVFINGVRVPTSRMDSLDRTQIESVEVLKGNAAVAQFGEGAATGVILIKTKTGSSDPK